MEMKPTDQSTVNSAQRTDEIGCAGVNLGFGFCKLVLDGQPDCFMSALAPLSKGIEGLSGRTPEQRNIVRDNEGRQYEVGMDAVLSTTDEPLKVLSREWGRSKQYKLLMGAVLNRMALTGKRRWVITTGLAADHYQDEEYRAEVQKLWMGHHGTHITPFGAVQVVGVMVVPETAGGFGALATRPETLDLLCKLDGAVLDFGRMTVNWLPFRPGQPDAARMSSVDVGVSNVIAEATKTIRRETRNPNLHPLDVEAAMLGYRPIHKLLDLGGGQPTTREVDVNIHIANAVDEVWPKISQALDNNMGDLRGKLLLGIGGGAKVFGERLKHHYDKSMVMLPEGGQMANATGLYLLARKSQLKLAA